MAAHCPNIGSDRQADLLFTTRTLYLLPLFFCQSVSKIRTVVSPLSYQVNHYDMNPSFTRRHQRLVIFAQLATLIALRARHSTAKATNPFEHPTATHSQTRCGNALEGAAPIRSVPQYTSHRPRSGALTVLLAARAPDERRTGPVCRRRSRQQPTASQASRPECAVCAPEPACQHHSRAHRHDLWS